ncbi:uncharacterized protein LOC130558194 isoform X2 [Triplophysa rosa]|uniref:uncharacterized protein LOC130558194 isoform X2 n=1 Tax=Triplophysa rosa TaxID=992332 RepID=UPI00254618A3|nr:uncharacterized protein LOC130558194 isoform X2 [Triplophysa rosa]
MSADVLRSAFAWTLRGLLCTWRFFWVSPYYAINAPQPAADTLHQSWSKPSSEKCVQRERTSALHRTLLRAEGEIQELKEEISNQRASWDMRFVELRKRQHDLREQLTSEILGRSARLYRDADSEEASEVFTESGLENGLSEEQRHPCSGGLKRTGVLREDRLCGGQASWPSVMDTRHRRSGGRPHRVFVPHSPLELKIGHRVRIMLPSGRIRTGTIRYLGRVSNSSDCRLGVELEAAENGQHDGTCEGQRYFDCEAGHGAFVTVSKLLMAWE